MLLGTDSGDLWVFRHDPKPEIIDALAAAENTPTMKLARAAQIQAELLPRECPAIAGFELSACCMPAQWVGGDFYDWQQIAPNLLKLTVGDVMGKGMPAALLMAAVRTVLRSVASDNDPVEAVQSMAATLDDDLGRSGAFVTLFHAQIDTATKYLTDGEKNGGWPEHAEGHSAVSPAYLKGHITTA